MRIQNIISSIANVCRFSARVDSMYRAFDALLQRQWHLQQYAAPAQARHSGTNSLFWNLGTVGTPITGIDMPVINLPGTSEPSLVTGNTASKPFFQRLS